MKIVTPLSNSTNFEALVEAGADEFYCGFIPYEWLNLYSNIISLNRREFLRNCNICTISSMKIIKKMVEKYHVPVKITLNSHYYNRDQYPILVEIIKKLMDIGFDTFIIADISLIIYLNDMGIECKVHLSSEVGSMNELTIQLFENFGIKRYIFPRRTAIAEIGECIDKCSNKDVEYEAFVLNELCLYTGAFCNTIHCDEMQNSCLIPTTLDKKYEGKGRFEDVWSLFRIRQKMKVSSINSVNNEYTWSFGETGCGVCKIREMIDVGITHVKVVGRVKSLDLLMKDVKNVREIIRLAYKEINKDNFVDKVRSDYFTDKCPDNCYYF